MIGVSNASQECDAETDSIRIVISENLNAQPGTDVAPCLGRWPKVDRYCRCALFRTFTF
jgi:hypothetical protein